jgi:hypothetical protein
MNHPNQPRPIDYESCAARIRNPTCPKQLKIDRAWLEYYDRFDWFFGEWADRASPY